MVERIDAHWTERGFGLWAVEVDEVRARAEHRSSGSWASPSAVRAAVRGAPSRASRSAGGSHRPWWGLGLATEAAAEVLRHAFDDLRL